MPQNFQTVKLFGSICTWLLFCASKLHSNRFVFDFTIFVHFDVCRSGWPCSFDSPEWCCCGPWSWFMGEGGRCGRLWVSQDIASMESQLQVVYLLMHWCDWGQEVSSTDKRVIPSSPKSPEDQQEWIKPNLLRAVSELLYLAPRESRTQPGHSALFALTVEHKWFVILRQNMVPYDMILYYMFFHGLGKVCFCGHVSFPFLC